VRALVTGGTGFVGSHLLEALVAAGAPVRALARDAAKASRLGIDGVEWVAGDLGDPDRLAEAGRGVTVVFHVAGLVAARSELEFLAVNRDATERLLRAVAPTGARFVLVSSLAAAGPTVPGRPLSGEEPPRPVTAYGRSKLAAEEVVRAGPLPWTIVRPPTVYGPRDRELLRLFRAAFLGLAPVFGDGSQELSVVYAPDLAGALVAAARAPGAAGRTYFAAHREICTSRQLATAVARAMGRRPRVVGVPEPLARGLLQVTGAVARLADRATILTPDKGNEFLAPAWTCRPDALERDTGWQAAHDLADGIRRTLAWYRAQGWLR
jgi:nucleoside-diphosphate-sugar epimerase